MLLKVFAFPFRGSVLADYSLLGELDVVKRPLGSSFRDVAQINLDYARLVHVADPKVQLVHRFVVLARLLSKKNDLGSQKLAVDDKALGATVSERGVNLS